MTFPTQAHIDAAQLRAAAPNADPTIIAAIAVQSDSIFAKYGITNRNRVLGFLSTALEETGGFRVLSENLNYSAERLLEVWPSRFPTLSVAVPYAHNPRALANRVYGGRMGNVGADDGWLYRGRGLIQITGRDNYALVAKLTGLPLTAQPDLAADPAHMLECSVALFSQYSGIASHCDREEWQAVWALVGTGSASGRVINLAAHQAALSRLDKALPNGNIVPPPPDIPTPPKPAPVSLWRRILAWLLP